MKLKRIYQFEVNEGFSSLFKGFTDVFKSKKSRIDSFLKEIQKLKQDVTENRVSVERQIWELPKDNTPEYRFLLSNLQRQLRVYETLKNQEINSIVKEADSLIENNPKLQAYFSSEISKIDVSSHQNLLKGLSKFRSKSDLNSIVSEFDLLVKDANKKSSYFEAVSGRGEDYSTKINASEQLIDFIENTPGEAQNIIDGYSIEDLKDLLNKLNELRFDIDITKKNDIDLVRKDLKDAKKIGDSEVIRSLEKEEMKIRSHYKMVSEKINEKIELVKKQIILIKNETYKA